MCGLVCPSNHLQFCESRKEEAVKILMSSVFSTIDVMCHSLGISEDGNCLLLSLLLRCYFATMNLSV